MKFSQKENFEILSNAPLSSRFVKLSTCKNDSNFQFVKLSPHKIKMFYSKSFTKSFSFYHLIQIVPSLCKWINLVIVKMYFKEQIQKQAYSNLLTIKKVRCCCDSFIHFSTIFWRILWVSWTRTLLNAECIMQCPRSEMNYIKIYDR